MAIFNLSRSQPIIPRSNVSLDCGFVLPTRSLKREHKTDQNKTKIQIAGGRINGNGNRRLYRDRPWCCSSLPLPCPLHSPRLRCAGWERYSNGALFYSRHRSPLCRPTILTTRPTGRREEKALEIVLDNFNYWHPRLIWEWIRLVDNPPPSPQELSWTNSSHLITSLTIILGNCDTCD